mgnify:FL=1
MEVNSQYVEHHLKAAIAEWYSWLADKAIDVDEWLSVPSWCKRVPSRLDIPWALKDLGKRLNHQHMMRVLFVIVDEVWLCSQEMDGVPDITKLRDELRKVDNV